MSAKVAPVEESPCKEKEGDATDFNTKGGDEGDSGLSHKEMVAERERRASQMLNEGLPAFFEKDHSLLASNSNVEPVLGRSGTDSSVGSSVGVKTAIEKLRRYESSNFINRFWIDFLHGLRVSVKILPIQLAALILMFVLASARVWLTKFKFENFLEEMIPLTTVMGFTWLIALSSVTGTFHIPTKRHLLACGLYIISVLISVPIMILMAKNGWSPGAMFYLAVAWQSIGLVFYYSIVWQICDTPISNVLNLSTFKANMWIAANCLSFGFFILSFKTEKMEWFLELLLTGMLHPFLVAFFARVLVVDLLAWLTFYYLPGEIDHMISVKKFWTVSCPIAFQTGGQVAIFLFKSRGVFFTSRCLSSVFETTGILFNLLSTKRLRLQAPKPGDGRYQRQSSAFRFAVERKNRSIEKNDASKKGSIDEEKVSLMELMTPLFVRTWLAFRKGGAANYDISWHYACEEIGQKVVTVFAPGIACSLLFVRYKLGGDPIDWSEIIIRLFISYFIECTEHSLKKVCLFRFGHVCISCRPDVQFSFREIVSILAGAIAIALVLMCAEFVPSSPAHPLLVANYQT